MTGRTQYALKSPLADTAAELLGDERPSVGATLAELLDNARRSGASRISIETGAGVCTVRDNGCGIRTPAAIIDAGADGWETERVITGGGREWKLASEEPTGFGLLMLAGRSLEIETQAAGAGGWTARLDESALTLRRVLVREGPRDSGPGTTVRFAMADNEHWAVKQASGVASQFLDAEVTLDGEAVERPPAVGETMAVRRWNGVSIRVIRVHDDSGHARSLRERPETWVTDDAMRGGRANCSLFGRPLQLRGLPRVPDPEGFWTVELEICSQTPVRLEWKSRTRLEWWKGHDETALQVECLRAVYETADGANEGGPLPQKAIARARSMGIAMTGRAAALRLPEWFPGQTSKLHSAEPYALIVDDKKLLGNEQQMLHAAQRAGADLPPLVAADKAMEGHDGYDSLARIVAVETTVTTSGVETRVGRLEPLDSRMPADGLADSIEHRLVIEGPGERRTLTAPGVIALSSSSKESDWPEGILIRKGAKLGVRQIAGHVVDGYGPYEEEPGGTNSDDRMDDAVQRVGEIVAGKANGVIERLSLTLDRLGYLVPDGKQVTIIKPWNGPAKVRLVDETETAAGETSASTGPAGD